jgi:hypothetical protein
MPAQASIHGSVQQTAAATNNHQCPQREFWQKYWSQPWRSPEDAKNSLEACRVGSMHPPRPASALHVHTLRALQVETAVMLYCRATATGQLATRADKTPGNNLRPQRAHTSSGDSKRSARKKGYVGTLGRSRAEGQLTGPWGISGHEWADC